MQQKHIKRRYRSILGDTLTPVSIYTNLRDTYPGSCLLESSDYHSKEDSLSFICLEPIATFKACGSDVMIQQTDGTEKRLVEDQACGVFSSLKSFMASFHVGPDELAFETAGLFGYSSFEAVQYFEDISFIEQEDPIKRVPDLYYSFFRFVIVIDHFKNTITAVHHVLDDQEEDRLDQLIAELSITRVHAYRFRRNGEEHVMDRDQDFLEAVKQGIQHCKRGDVFQLVLSREFRQQYEGDDLNVYRTLRSVNPSPYLFYFDLGDFRLFGSSPESQLIVKEGKAFISPIAGTVKRVGDVEVDRSAEEHLRDDPKENAEHVMLVDLARNDLSRNTHDVEVLTYAEMQYFSHVIHMVSKVQGTLGTGKTGLEVYADTFPAGTLSGAPKYRALELINELEPRRRDFYGGAVGFWGFNGSVNHAIIIRSVLSRAKTLIYQAGAGVVVGSVPKSELQEVNNKIAAVRNAIEMAEQV